MSEYRSADLKTYLQKYNYPVISTMSFVLLGIIFFLIKVVVYASIYHLKV